MTRMFLAVSLWVATILTAEAAPTAWSEWAIFEPCDAPCGGGWEIYKRECRPYHTCYGPKEKKVECHTQACDYQEWKEWSDCDKVCGGGVQYRERGCPRSGYCAGSHREQRDCNQRHCPEYKWGDWSECSAPCGGGKRRKTEYCEKVDYATCDGQPRYEEEDCNTDLCLYGEWGDWSTCDKICGGGLSYRERPCGYGVGKCDGPAREEKTCYDRPCPIFTWAPWSDCSAPCGGGTRKRYEVCQQLGYGSCDGLPGLQEETCNTHECAYEPWKDWSDCDATCGEGWQYRERECGYGKGKCPGDYRERKACNLRPCPVWLEWESWSTCSEECGDYGGKRNRKRECSANYGKCDHDGEPGYRTMEEVCNKRRCPEYTQWESWESCSEPCGSSGIKRRHRKCEQLDYGACKPAGYLDQAPCNRFECSYDNWLDWGECDKSCGGGRKYRTRKCPGSYGGRCVGDHEEYQPCNTHDCSTWGDWGEYQACDKPCGGGKKKRYRHCIGSGCYGAKEEYLDCNTYTCTHEHAYEEYSAWSQCSRTCGVGRQVRRAKCREGMGYLCRDGDYKYDGRPCDAGPCERGSLGMAQWTEWDVTDCRISCTRERVRRRACVGGQYVTCTYTDRTGHSHTIHGGHYAHEKRPCTDDLQICGSGGGGSGYYPRQNRK